MKEFPLLKNYRAAINQRLESFFQAKITEAKAVSPEHAAWVRYLAKLTLGGGKRLRGFMVKLGFLLVKNIAPKAIIDISSVIELLHTAILVHDDIIDKADRRHNLPTLEHAYSPKGTKTARAAALLGGTLLRSFAQDLFNSSSLSAETKIDLLRFLGLIELKTALGEILDIEYSRQIIPRKKLLKLYDLKTGEYTFVSSLTSGAIIARSNQSKIDQIKKIALPLGQAFQIQDDIFDLFSSKQNLGKSVCLDIREGKPTYLFRAAFEKTTPASKKFLKSIFGRQEIAAAEISQVREIINASGARDLAEDRIAQNIARARDHLKTASLNPKGKRSLFKLIEFVFNRAR